MTPISVVGVVFAVAVLALITTLLLKRRLREKYATLWLIVGVAFLVLALFPELLSSLASAVGVAVPSNLLFAMVLALLIGVCLHLSWELSTAEEEVRRVAEETAIMRAQLEALCAQVDPPTGGESAPPIDDDGD